MPPFKERVDLVAMGLQTCGRLGLPHPTAGETRQVYVGLPKKVPTKDTNE